MLVLLAEQHIRSLVHASPTTELATLLPLFILSPAFLMTSLSLMCLCWTLGALRVAYVHFCAWKATRCGLLPHDCEGCSVSRPDLSLRQGP